MTARTTATPGALGDPVGTSAAHHGDPAASPLVTLLQARRSIRRLGETELSDAVVAELTETVRLTPAAYNLPPWHVVLVRERRAELWDILEAAMRSSLEGERLDRNLDRLAGFRPGAAVALVYEDRSVRPHLRDAWRITDAQAAAFVQQGIGGVQLTLWLALTEAGLVASLQHWDWLLPDGLTGFCGLDADRFGLVSALPIGLPAEAPRAAERPAVEDVFSLERR